MLQLLLRWRFLPALVVDYASHGRPMPLVLEAQCYQVATMKGPAACYQQVKLCQSGYAHTEHLSTCVCRDGLPTGCLLRASSQLQTQGLSTAASLSLQLTQSLKSMSTFCKSSRARKSKSIDARLRHATPGASCKIRCQPSRVMKTATRDRRKDKGHRTKDKRSNLLDY